jgi:hypothetical protein
MAEQRTGDTYSDLYRIAVCLGVLYGNLVWIVPALVTGGWEAIGMLPFATPVGALAGLCLALIARLAIAVTGERVSIALVAAVATALTGVLALLGTGGRLDPLSVLAFVGGPGALAGAAVALRRRLRRAPVVLLASTLVLSVLVVVVGSIHPARQAVWASQVAGSGPVGGDLVEEPTPMHTPVHTVARAEAVGRVAEIRAAVGDVVWFAEPAVMGYPCTGSDGVLGSAVSYSFSGSFRTDPVAVATDAPSDADVAAVQRISTALTTAGFVGRPFASGTVSTEFVGGDPAAPEQLLIAHGGSVTSVTYVGACVDGD